MPKATVLNVDDDENLQVVVGQYLEDDGYRVLKALTGKDLQERLPTANADVVLLDLVLPDAEGFSLIGKIREQSKAPIIIVSGKTDTTEKIVGLEMGADDYITKPFEMRELSARIKAVLRRSGFESPDDVKIAANSEGQEKIYFSGWCLDRTQYQLFDHKGKPADLTTGEFKLLEALVLAPQRVLSRDRLFEITREGDFDAFDRAIDIQVGRLRKKLGDTPAKPKFIKTVRGVGYMFCGKTDSNK
ncbi:MAG: response regulator transcription factor [Alphaproteobacteria bacterium]|nr:response regulator transcription factor [Alphaproteobacteria bacterium]